MKTTKEQKVTSLKLSKKIYDLAKKKGIKLESEYGWSCIGEFVELTTYKKFKIFCKVNETIEEIYSDNEFYPALDTTELGELLKDREERFADAFPYWDKGTWTNSHLSDEIRIEAEARGQLYLYLLKNNLL